MIPLLLQGMIRSMPMPRKPDPLKHCAFCSARLTRKRERDGDLESLLHFGRRRYCGRTCMARAFDARDSRSVDASTCRYHARKLVPSGPCSVCGKPDALDVHHKDGDFTNNTPSNLQRICRGCHIHQHRSKGSCSVCGRPVKGFGYCSMHYRRFKKHGDPLATKANQHTPIAMVVGATKRCKSADCA